MTAPSDEQLAAVLLALGSERLDVLEAAGAALGRTDAIGVLAVHDGVVLSDDHLRFEPPDGARANVDDQDLGVAGGAAVEFLLHADEHEAAGRLATRTARGDLLRLVVRSALRAHPPRVPAPTMRHWRDSGCLDATDPHADWLDVACVAAGQAPASDVIERHESVRQRFEDLDDLEAEVSVGLAMAIHARRANDISTLVRLAGRGEDLVAQGRTEPVAIAVLGRAIGKQLFGDAAGALAVLDEFPPDKAEGDWAAQVSMIRGTNLMLLGQYDEAVGSFRTATGFGSSWTYAVALELRGTARWHQGDPVGAIDDLTWSAAVAHRSGAVPPAQLAECHLAVMQAALGQPASTRTKALLDDPTVDSECQRLLAVATILTRISEGDEDAAATLARKLPTPDRAMRSAHWIMSLTVALDISDPTIDNLLEAQPSLSHGQRAGEEARRHLAEGPLASAKARHLLPAQWCTRPPPTVQIQLTNNASIRIDGTDLTHPDWDRARVRELCLHLALLPDTPRKLIATRLWPDLDPDAAGKNLRVTLTYLLKVLHPDRRKGTTSDLLIDDARTLSFAVTPRLRIDLREAHEAAQQIILSASAGDPAGVTRHTRELLRNPGGALLGRASPPPWAEHQDATRREQVLEAANAGTPVLARTGNHNLAAGLAQRGLNEDPWAERLHMVVVRAHLANDNLDAARRAMRTALTALDDIGFRPERTTTDLTEVLGMEPK